MKKAIAVKEKEQLSPQDIETLVAVGAIPDKTPPAVIEFYARVSADSRLSPFKRQLHLIRRGDKYTIQTSIDGYRTIADRTGKYAGNDDPIFTLDESQNPVAATVTVWKIVEGVRCAYTATARWKEYYPGEQLGFMWRKMPFLMLGKCAEALALRKAFPEETSGIFVEDEITIEPEIEVLRPKIEKTLETDGKRVITHLSDSSSGAEAQAQPINPGSPSKRKTTPAAAQPRKFTVPEPKVENPEKNQRAVLKRLNALGKSVAQFEQVAMYFRILDEGKTWDAITEEQFAECLFPDHWKLIEEKLKNTMEI